MTSLPNIEVEFERHRSLLEGLAYRMCGVMAEVQDLVQETHLRWCSIQDHGKIQHPRAWLVTTCTRLAMDWLKSARVQRETYVGTWLPEPFLSTEMHSPAPNAKMELDESVSMALMVALERLSPAERATFILHDVLEYDFAEIAEILGKAEATCRKLASRARSAVHADRTRYEASPQEHRQLLDAFLMAVQDGDAEPLKALLMSAVELHSDGGGRVSTVTEVLQGKDHVAAFFLEIWRNRVAREGGLEVVHRWFNGQPGVLLYQHEELKVAITFELAENGIHRIFALRHPQKLSLFLRS